MLPPPCPRNRQFWICHHQIIIWKTLPITDWGIQEMVMVELKGKQKPIRTLFKVSPTYSQKLATVCLIEVTMWDQICWNARNSVATAAQLYGTHCFFAAVCRGWRPLRDHLWLKCFFLCHILQRRRRTKWSDNKHWYWPVFTLQYCSFAIFYTIRKGNAKTTCAVKKRLCRRFWGEPGREKEHLRHCRQAG